jgi:hypothetical protein
MSKQFQLYLTSSDAVTLVDELRVRFGARVLNKKSSTSEPVEMQSPIEHESIFRGSGATSIYCYLAPANGRIVMDYYPTLRIWMIQTGSEAIEFSGGDFDGKTLLVGRMYFQTDDLADGRIVKKRAEFLKWADKVFQYTKKALKHNRELMKPMGAYIGKEALNFRESGGRFAESMRDAGARIRPLTALDPPPRIVH